MNVTCGGKPLAGLDEGDYLPPRAPLVEDDLFGGRGGAGGGGEEAQGGGGVGEHLGGEQSKHYALHFF